MSRMIWSYRWHSAAVSLARPLGTLVLEPTAKGSCKLGHCFSIGAASPPYLILLYQK